MADTDVESDSAILGTLAGIMSEDADVTRKSKLTNKSNTKRNTKGGQVGKNSTHDLRSQKDTTTSNNKTKRVPVVVKDTNVEQEKGLGSSGNENHADAHEIVERVTNSVRDSSPSPGCSRDGHYREDSPNRNPKLTLRKEVRFDKSDRGYNYGAKGQGDNVCYPYKSQIHDARTGSSRDCGSAPSLPDRLTGGRPSRARGSGEVDGGRRWHAEADESDDRSADVAARVFTSSDDDRPPCDGRGVSRPHYSGKVLSLF